MVPKNLPASCQERQLGTSQRTEGWGLSWGLAKGGITATYLVISAKTQIGILTILVKSLLEWMRMIFRFENHCVHFVIISCGIRLSRDLGVGNFAGFPSILEK